MASEALEQFVSETIRLAAVHGYHPTVFIEMRKRHLTVNAISRLVISSDIQSGFKRLAALNLKEWTIEAAVVKFPHEFSPEVVQAAQWRLTQADN